MLTLRQIASIAEVGHELYDWKFQEGIDAQAKREIMSAEKSRAISRLSLELASCRSRFDAMRSEIKALRRERNLWKNVAERPEKTRWRRWTRRMRLRNGQPILPESLQTIANLLHSFSPHPLVPPCVYFLLLGQRILYVGQTINLTARLQTHRLSKQFDQVMYLPVPEHQLDDVETAFIRKLKPPLNRMVPNSQPRPSGAMERFGLEISTDSQASIEIN